MAEGEAPPPPWPKAVNEENKVLQVKPDENIPGFSATTADGKEMTVGPVGTALLWLLLIFLFGLSLFFTFARAFLPDMEQPAQMDMMWMAPTLFSMLK